MDPLDDLLETLDDLIETGMAELNYADFAVLLKVVDKKVAEFTAKAKKLKDKHDEIKEVVRLRMIEEKLPACDTENGRLRPTQSDCIVMHNFELFKEWLREDMDRLSYLKQGCFDSNKMKQMHTDPDDVLPRRKIKKWQSIKRNL